MTQPYIFIYLLAPLTLKATQQIHNVNTSRADTISLFILKIPQKTPLMLPNPIHVYLYIIRTRPLPLIEQ